MLLSKQYRYGRDQEVIAKQMNSTDQFRNNALHKACHLRGSQMINLLLCKGIGSLKERNVFGSLPHEVPHNSIVNDGEIEAVFKTYLDSLSFNDKEELA